MADTCVHCGTGEALTHYDVASRTGDQFIFQCDDCASCHKVERDLRCEACFIKGAGDE